MYPNKQFTKVHVYWSKKFFLYYYLAESVITINIWTHCGEQVYFQGKQLSSPKGKTLLVMEQNLSI